MSEPEAQSERIETTEAAETIRGARMTGISADEALSRSLENHLFRRRRKRATPAHPP